jgi:hypothetical protein
VFSSYRQPVAEAVSFLSGAGLTVPTSIEAARRVLGALDEDDAYLVSELGKEWDDLQVGIAAAKPVIDVIAEDPGLFGRAREAAALTDSELPNRAQSARDELADLLAAGDLVNQLPKVRILIDTVVSAREEHLTTERRDASVDLEVIRAELAEEADDLDVDVVEAAIAARLAALDPSGATTVEQVLARRARFAESADLVRADLDAVRSQGRIVRLSIASSISEAGQGPIRSVADLDVCLDVVRSIAIELLDDGKEVRLT